LLASHPLGLIPQIWQCGGTEPGSFDGNQIDDISVITGHPKKQS
jgi:hypothetical protein